MSASSILLPSTTARNIDTSRKTEEEIAFRAFLDENLAGQDEAKDAVVSILNAIRDPLRDPNRPIDISLFIGPSTAGKTRAFKLLVQWVHGSQEKMVFVSGSDFEEKHQVQSLIGAPHGYIGYVDKNDAKYRAPQPGEPDDSALLSQHNLDNSKLGCKDDVVFILFDEWEKFHAAFNRFMLRPMREGHGKLNNGQAVNFRNVVMCYTSNLAAGELERQKNPLGFTGHKEKISSGEVRKTVTHELRNYPPEFRNRIDRIVCFTELGNKELFKVVDIELATYNQRVMALPPERIFILTMDDSAKAFLLKRNDDSAELAGDEKGAIPAMQQAMRHFVSEPISRMVRLGVVHAGDKVEVSHKDGDSELTFKVFADPVAEMLKGISPAGDAVSGETAPVSPAAASAEPAATPAAPAAEKPAAAASDGAGDNQSQGSSDLSFSSMVTQGFMVVLRTAGERHNAIRNALVSSLEANPGLVRIMEEHSIYGDTSVVHGILMDLNVTSLKVVAPIEFMVQIKQQLPFLEVSTLPTAL